MEIIRMEDDLGIVIPDWLVEKYGIKDGDVVDIDEGTLFASRDADSGDQDA